MFDWFPIDDLVQNNFVSMRLDRPQPSDNHLINRINAVCEISGERTIVQADGAPMSGGSDDLIPPCIRWDQQQNKRAGKNA